MVILSNKAKSLGARLDSIASRSFEQSNLELALISLEAVRQNSLEETLMKTRTEVVRRRRWLPGLVVFLVVACGLLPAAHNLFAQESSGGGAMLAALGAMMFFFFIFALAMYVYTALALQTIAKKTNTENAWLAWIPIVNIILMLNIAKKPIWWIILCLIPLVNIVIFIILWMAVAEARHKPSWWGILIIVPLVGLIVPGYLAWSD